VASSNPEDPIERDREHAAALGLWLVYFAFVILGSIWFFLFRLCPASRGCANSRADAGYAACRAAQAARSRTCFDGLSAAVMKQVTVQV